MATMGTTSVTPRQGNGKNRSFPDRALHGDLPAMKRHYFLHQRQPDPAAFKSPRGLALHLGEPVENTSELIFGGMPIPYPGW